MKTARFALQMALGIALPLLVQLADRRRFDDDQRARMWNFATWGAALYAFGPASMLGWAWVTRPRWRWYERLGAGIGVAALLFGALALVDLGFGAIFPGSDPS